MRVPSGNSFSRRIKSSPCAQGSAQFNGQELQNRLREIYLFAQVVARNLQKIRSWIQIFMAKIWHRRKGWACFFAGRKYSLQLFKSRPRKDEIHIFYWTSALKKLVLQGAGGRGINISNHKSQCKSRENTKETQHNGQGPCLTDENLPTQLHYDKLWLNKKVHVTSNWINCR